MFDGFRLDVSKRLVFDPFGQPVALKAKAFETLLFLVQNPGRVVDRDELMNAVWPDTAVEENNLTQHVSSLRRALGEKKNDHRFIITLAGHGYKFVAEVCLLTQPSKVTLTSRSGTGRTRTRGQFVLLAAGLLAILVLSGFVYQRWASGTAGRIESIAVLPFKPVSEQDRNPSFEMGLANDLITRLEGSEGLRVRPFQAVRRYSSEVAPVTAGHELGVDAVLDTTIQYSERRVRISTKLIKIDDASQLWSKSFDSNRADLFALQDEMTERVATALRIALSESAKKHHTNSVAAYELYLDGRYHQFNLEPSEARLGIAKFEEAVALDPNYAAAYAGIARGYMSLALSSELPPGEMAERSFEAAERAVSIDPELAEAHAMLGAANVWFKHDWASAEKALKKALDLEPNSAFAHLYYAVLLGNTGRIDEALAESKKASDLDAFSAYSTSMQGTTLVHAGLPNEALERFTEASRLNPRLWTPHCKAALALIDLRRWDEAVAEAQKALELNSKQTNSTAYESYALAKLGRREDAKRRLDEMLAQAANGYVPPYHIAIAYAGLGDRRNALTWLERAYAEADPKILFLRSERFWKEYRSEPRYLELLKRMNLDPPD